MNIFRRIMTLIKKKFPATFNAVEYETQRILDRIEKSESVTAHILDKTNTIEQDLISVSERLNNIMAFEEKSVNELTNSLEKNTFSIHEQLDDSAVFARQSSNELKNKLEESFTSFAKQLKEVIACEERFIKEIAIIKETTTRYELTEKHYHEIISGIKEDIANQNRITDERFNKSEKKLDDLKQIAIRCDLNGIASCKSDNDYDKRLIPINKYFNNRGMAISMHLTSVADKPDPIVYETADITRTAALSLAADEIHARKLDGAVAELGVAQGKFARVINALFPEKTLHLFDTFEGFPKNDILVDRERNFSNASEKSYADIDMNMMLKSMRYPGQCVFHKGYFPDTAKGFEETFCFVNIDCDLYNPILAGLEYFYPRLIKGGYIFVHDYRSYIYAGVKAALVEFADKHGISYCVIPDNTGTAIITK